MPTPNTVYYIHVIILLFQLPTTYTHNTRYIICYGKYEILVSTYANQFVYVLPVSIHAYNLTYLNEKYMEKKPNSRYTNTCILTFSPFLRFTVYAHVVE